MPQIFTQLLGTDSCTVFGSGHSGMITPPEDEYQTQSWRVLIVAFEGDRLPNFLEEASTSNRDLIGDDSDFGGDTELESWKFLNASEALTAYNQACLSSFGMVTVLAKPPLGALELEITLIAEHPFAHHPGTVERMSIMHGLRTGRFAL